MGETVAWAHRYATGTVEVDPVVLKMDVDDQLLARITMRLKAISA